MAKNGTTWQKGKSGNPKGPPKKGERWKEIISRVGALSGKEAASLCKAMATRFAPYPEGVTLKELAILSAFSDAINNPTPGMLRVLIEAQGEENEGGQGITISINGAKWRPD